MFARVCEKRLQRCGWYAKDPSGTTQNAFMDLHDPISVAGQPLNPAIFAVLTLVAGSEFERWLEEEEAGATDRWLKSVGKACGSTR